MLTNAIITSESASYMRGEEKRASSKTLTHALRGHHAWDLGRGGPHGVERLGPGGGRAHGVGHVLEVWWKKAIGESVNRLDPVNTAIFRCLTGVSNVDSV